MFTFSMQKAYLSILFHFSNILHWCLWVQTYWHIHKHQNWSRTSASAILNHDLVPSMQMQALREIPNTKQKHPTDSTHLISFFPRTLMSSQHSLISAVVALFWAIASSSISICPHQQCSYNIGWHQWLWHKWLILSCTTFRDALTHPALFINTNTAASERVYNYYETSDPRNYVQHSWV